MRLFGEGTCAANTRELDHRGRATRRIGAWTEAAAMLPAGNPAKCLLSGNGAGRCPVLPSRVDFRTTRSTTVLSIGRGATQSSAAASRERAAILRRHPWGSAGLILKRCGYSTCVSGNGTGSARVCRQDDAVVAVSSGRPSGARVVVHLTSHVIARACCSASRRSSREG
jgi:hypothetical protein